MTLLADLQAELALVEQAIADFYDPEKGGGRQSFTDDGTTIQMADIGELHRRAERLRRQIAGLGGSGSRRRRPYNYGVRGGMG